MNVGTIEVLSDGRHAELEKYLADYPPILTVKQVVETRLATKTCFYSYPDFPRFKRGGRVLVWKTELIDWLCKAESPL